MSAAKTLWLVNAVLFFLAGMLARDVLGARFRRVRRERRRLLEITRDMLDARPNSDELRAAWAVIIREATPKASSGELVSDAVCLLESASDARTDSLRRIIEPHVNALNDVAAYIDEGLVRPKDIVKYFPELHATLLNDLPLIVPFIWFQSILRGRGRWGYRPIRLKEILEQLRPVSPWEHIRGPLLIEVEGFALLSLAGLGSFERLLQVGRIAFRSPTIDVPSKLRQLSQRDELIKRLKKLGVRVVEETPGKAVEW